MKMVWEKCLIAGGILAILFIGSHSLSGVKIEIVNLDTVTMKNVSVNVRGASYHVGDIPAAKNTWIKVQPRSESSLAIQYLDAAGKQHILPIDTYIERGYSGKITARVKNGRIMDIEQNIKLTPIG